MKIECPLGLNQVHCPNCHFNRDGECHYKAIMGNPERAEEFRVEILDSFVGIFLAGVSSLTAAHA